MMWRGALRRIVFAQKFAVSQPSRGIESARRGKGGHDGSIRETDD
jgi:hypothetical protein